MTVFISCFYQPPIIKASERDQLKQTASGYIKQVSRIPNVSPSLSIVVTLERDVLHIHN